jgi:TonB family protein
VKRFVAIFFFAASLSTAQALDAYSIGNGVSAPTVRKKVEPKYSKEGRDAGIRGEVWLTVVIDSKGEPRDVAVTRKLGYGLDEKAVDAVKEWLFNPGVKDGQPVAVRATIAISFQLLNDKKMKELETALPGALAQVDASDPERRAITHRVILDAQFFLASAYDYGEHGFGENKNEALRLFRNCSAKKHLGCQFRLGRLLLYWPGRTVQQYLEAYAWLEIAATDGSTDAGTLLQIEPPQLTPAGRELVNRLKPALLKK